MLAFAKLIDQFHISKESQLKVDALTGYLNKASDSDKIIAIKLLFGLRPRRITNLHELRDLAGQLTLYPDWLFEQSLEATKDLCETITLIVPQGKAVTTSLSQEYQNISNLHKSDNEDRDTAIITFWNNSDLTSRLVFNKFISGTFRTTLSIQELTTAIALHLDIPKYFISYRINKINLIDNKSFDEFCLPHRSDYFAKPYKFPNHLEWEENNGDQWKSIKKYEGIPLQIIKRNKRIYLYLKGYGLVNEYFTQIVDELYQVGADFTLVGQLMMAGESTIADDLKYSSQSLTTHLNKRGSNKKSAIPIHFICHDLLELGLVTLEIGYEGRLKQLDHFFSRHQSELPPYFNLAEVNDFEQGNHSDKVFILKQSSDLPDMPDFILSHSAQRIRAVLLYAHRAEGWSSSNNVAYTFAVKDRDESLIPLTKAYAGLHTEEYPKIDAFIRNNVVERFGPTRSVKPSIVAEIWFDKVETSNRRKSGVVLVNPIIHQIRWDDAIDSITSLREVVDLI